MKRQTLRNVNALLLCNVKCVGRLNACPQGPIYLCALTRQCTCYSCVIRDQGLTEDPSRDPVCVLYLAAYHSYYGMTVVCVLINA